MTKAQKIMKKKAFIKAEMDRQLTKKQSDYLWRKATGRLNEILDQYADLPKGVHTHTDSFIFPAAAIYLTAKEYIPEKKAYSIIENAAICGTAAKGEKLAKLMRIPGMASLFVAMWDPVSRKMFGENCGFQNVFYPKEKGAYRMDIVSCPYNRYFTELGCPELTKIFCDNDERAYGNLPGLKFIRTGTLGKGAERCDFYLKKEKQGQVKRKIQKTYYSPSVDGFYGAFYECPVPSEKAVILMAGDDIDDRLVISGVKWLHLQGCHVMAMAPDKKDYGHHNYPLERFGKAIEVLSGKGCSKIGILGASTTGMLALLAASYYPQISLTVAISPPDFVMEGFYQDGKDGMRERPGDNESSVSWEGKPLPYLPYAYRHPEYWQKIKEASKAGKDMVASRPMFDESERRHPVREEEKIKVEKICGNVLCIGAEDDVLWDTCKYIRRMEMRLTDRPHSCTFKALLYEHGTHFAFPESMLKMMLPVGSGLLVGAAFRAGRQYPKECRETRKDIDRKLQLVIRKW